MTRARPDERDRTDDSLRSERDKTDDELVRHHAQLQDDTDRAVVGARVRADALVRAARDSADTDASPDGAGLSAERAREDRALAAERAVVDRERGRERNERQRLLASLLQLERDTTDASLTSERSYADAAVAARDDFLGMVSHDLRTLIGGVGLNAAMIAKEAAVEGSADRVVVHARMIQRFVTRMTRLVGDLDDVASIEAGRFGLVPEQLDAARLLRETVDAFQAVAASRGLALAATMAPDALLATFDHERILQVLGNLVSNAIKFTPAGGRIDIAVEPRAGEVVFSVRDTGTGIAPDAREAVFERFWQTDRTTRAGLGLGLYISRCIVEAHRGRIWVEAGDGPGTTVCFTLPRAAA